MFLDIAVGTSIAFLVSAFFGVEPSVCIAALAIGFALLPDIDIVFLLFKEDSKIFTFFGGHRGIFHRPIIYVPIAVVVFVGWGMLVGTLFVAGVLWHLVHDTLILGWGIKWLWPFSMRSIKFFPDKNGKVTNIPVLTWLPQEEPEIRSKFASPHWIRDFYFRPSIISLTEYPLFLLALYLILSYLSKSCVMM